MNNRQNTHLLLYNNKYFNTYSISGLGRFSGSEPGSAVLSSCSRLSALFSATTLISSLAESSLFLTSFGIRLAGGAGSGDILPSFTGLSAGENLGLGSRSRFLEGSRSRFSSFLGLGFLSDFELDLLLLLELLPLVDELVFSDFAFFGLFSRRLEEPESLFLVSERLVDFESPLAGVDVEVFSSAFRRRRGSRLSFPPPDST